MSYENHLPMTQEHTDSYLNVIPIGSQDQKSFPISADDKTYPPYVNAFRLDTTGELEIALDSDDIYSMPPDSEEIETEFREESSDDLNTDIYDGVPQTYANYDEHAQASGTDEYHGDSLYVIKYIKDRNN